MTSGHDNTSIRGEAVARTRVTRRQALGLALVAGAGGLLLAACGDSATASSTPQAAATVAPAPTVAAATTGASATTTAVPATRKVNANTASQAELLAAFQAANIPSADRWVREVLEYRPYPTDDPTFAKLRTELAKYNPAPGAVDQIVATLSLS